MADPTQHQDASGTADLSGAGEFRIFLSYRREDASGHAGRLFDFLHHGGGAGPGFRTDQIFMDIDTVAPGVDFRRVIEQAVGSCDVFIAVIGRQWLNAADAKGRRRLDYAQDFVRLEIEAALERDIPVVPTLVQGAQMPTEEELPETLHAFVHRNAVELSDARWSYDVGRLVAWLQTVEKEKTRRGQAGRERAERAERKRADQERLERDRAERLAAERAERERDERARREREQAEQAEQERAEQEGAETDQAERERHGARPFPNEAVRQREERQHAARERERLRQPEDERRRYHHEPTPPEGRHSRQGNDKQRESERRRFSRKHVLVVAALLALAIAGIASPLVLFSETEKETTGEVTTTQPTTGDGALPGDADRDGFSDAVDQFALDPENGKELPVTLTFADAKPGTIKESGFTGLMTDGTTPYRDLFDPDNVIVADGTFEVSAVGRGAAFKGRNSQRNAFQFGIRVPNETFTAHVNLIKPFADVTPSAGQSMGLFVGTGDQNNFVKLGVDGGGEAVKLRGEDRGATIPFEDSNTHPLDLPGPDTVDLYLTIDPAAKTIQAEARVTEGGETSPVATFPPMKIPARWVDGDEALAVGIISSRGGAARFAAIWGIVEVDKGNPPPITGDDPSPTTDTTTTTDTDTDTDTDLTEPVVPNVVGLTEESARDELQRAGFEVTVGEATDDDTAAGLVAAQSPDGGSQAASGSTVLITISTGPERGT